MSLSSGRTQRPVTILVFTDKLVVVKRKAYDLSSRECFEKFKENISNDTSTQTLKKKVMELCTGTSLEFKGLVDIKATEIFDGLKGKFVFVFYFFIFFLTHFYFCVTHTPRSVVFIDRPDTFLLRTSLPELADDDIESEYEDYFRRSDRLFSVIPNKSGFHADKMEEYKDNRKTLISLYQHQFARLNFTGILSKKKSHQSFLFIYLLFLDENEVFHESNFALPAYAYVYNEKSYKKSNIKVK
jgi:hypothetical protein